MNWHQTLISIFLLCFLIVDRITLLEGNTLGRSLSVVSLIGNVIFCFVVSNKILQGFQVLLCFL